MSPDCKSFSLNLMVLAAVLAGMAMYPSRLSGCVTSQIPVTDGVKVIESERPYLLYDEVLTPEALQQVSEAGALKYWIVYQDDCDRGASKTGVVDTRQVLRHIAEMGGGRGPGEWAVLDFEIPFDDWMKEGPGTEHWRIANDSLCKTIDAAKRAFPTTKWTYYGVPRLDFYLDGKSWLTATDEAKAAELAKQLRNYSEVMSRCDWLAPSVYMVVGDRSNGGKAGTLQQDETHAWTKAMVAMCRDFVQHSGKVTPILPFVSPVYQGGGSARFQSVIPDPIVARCTIAPIINAGGGGIACWTAASYMTKVITNRQDSELPSTKDNAAALINWAEDLGTTPDELRTESGVRRMQRLYSDATARMIRGFKSSWPKMPSPRDAADPHTKSSTNK